MIPQTTLRPVFLAVSILGALVFLADCGGVDSPNSGQGGGGALPPSESYGDTFTQANGPLSANWTTITGAACPPKLVNHWLMASQGHCVHAIAAFSAGTFSANQWSNTIVGAGDYASGTTQTLAVRSSGASTYNDAYVYGSNGWIIGIINPTVDWDSAMATAAPKPGDTIELDVAGTDPVFFWSRLNGTVNAATLDTTYLYGSGSPGVGVNELLATPTAQAGTWKGGSLPELSTVPADTFQRPDAGWLGVDWWFPWQGDENGGGWKLSGNQAVPVVSESGRWNLAIWTSPLGANPTSRITIGNYAAQNWLGALVRYTPQRASTDNFYAAIANAGQIKLWARVHGQWQTLTTYSYTPAAGDTLELAASGSGPVTLTVKVNGHVTGSYTDSTYNLAGQYAGFLLFGSTATTVRHWSGGTA